MSVSVSETMLRRILCPTDFSPAARNAVRTAASLAEQHDAELVLLHAWFVPMPSYTAASVLPGRMIASVREEAERQLAMAADDAVQAGARRVTTRLVRGVAWTSIIDVLEREPIDLCVIGTRGLTGVSGMLVGSVARKILRNARAPVLTIRPDVMRERYRHVMCPTDFSQSSEVAVELARELVAPGGQLTLVHVLPYEPRLLGGPKLAYLASRWEAEATRLLSARAGQIRGDLVVSTRMLYGSTADELLREVERDESIDLVAMGNAGRSEIARLVLGSVAEQLIYRARTPVLIGRRGASAPVMVARSMKLPRPPPERRIDRAAS